MEDASELIYAFDGSNYQETFHIDNETGVLSAIRILDREAKERYEVNVVATDFHGNEAKGWLYS